MIAYNVRQICRNLLLLGGGGGCGWPAALFWYTSFSLSRLLHPLPTTSSSVIGLGVLLAAKVHIMFCAYIRYVAAAQPTCVVQYNTIPVRDPRAGMGYQEFQSDSWRDVRTGLMGGPLPGCTCSYTVLLAVQAFSRRAWRPLGGRSRARFGGWGNKEALIYSESLPRERERVLQQHQDFWTFLHPRFQNEVVRQIHTRATHTHTHTYRIVDFSCSSGQVHLDLTLRALPSPKDILSGRFQEFWGCNNTSWS